jgi:2-(1,2-epoxy-1,2-dihydrophenyl)acetyl-CoA isomerase
MRDRRHWPPRPAESCYDTAVNDTVLYAVDGPVATVTLNRPDRLNAMNLTVTGEMTEALDAAAVDDSVRVVILTGAGRGFCAGGDLENFAAGLGPAAPPGATGPSTFEETFPRLRGAARSSELLHDMPKVTIAAINGACAGAGMSWACACDLRYAATSAVFNTAFLGAGVSGDLGGHWLLPRIVGPAKARELYLLADKFDAAEAARIGLVSKVLPGEELLPFVRDVAARLAAKAPLAVAAVKANQNETMDLGFAAMLDRETERHVRTGLTADAQEAAQAFLAKRPPVFRGA